MTIKLIVIHCAATANGRQLSNSKQTAAQRIDDWHRDAGFKRTSPQRLNHNPELHHIGYHYVIDTDGTLETGRAISETGAHVRGRNTGSVGICLVGTDKFTRDQWAALTAVVLKLQAQFPHARLCGHRDLSPDLNGDGKISRNEWVKICPGFTVADWLAGGMQPLAGHIVEEG